jgi:hypothetical protein
VGDEPEAQLQDWAVVEEDAILCRLDKRPRPLVNALGLGGRLEVRRGPFNNVGDVVPLACAVRDAGLLEDVVIDGSEARLELTDSLEPDEKYFVIWWDRTGLALNLLPNLIPGTTGGNWWQVELPEDAENPIAVAIAYNGTRVGLWFRHDDWATGLEAANLPPRQKAGLLRWLWLPVLADEAKAVVRRLALDHPAEVLLAWLYDEEPHELPGLRWRQRAQGWDTVIRAAFADWQPDGPTVERLLDDVATHSRISPALVPLVIDLCEVAPLLMGRVLHLKMVQHRAKNGVHHTRVYLHNTACDILNLAAQTGIDVLRRHRDALLAESARFLGDSAFVEDLLRAGTKAFAREKLPPVCAANLALAQNTVDAFRRLLAVTLIEHIRNTL